MDREKARQLLALAMVSDTPWRYREIKHRGEFLAWNLLPEDTPLVSAAGDAPGQGQLMAAAPDLARWGIALDEECERLWAELAQAREEATTLRAELDSLRALVAGVCAALVSEIPGMAISMEGQTLPPGVTP